MQKRIDYLNDLRIQANNDMKEAQAIGDPWRYQDAVNRYNPIARELTWLTEVQSLIKPSIAADSYSEVEYGVMAIRLTFAGVTIPTPFNKVIYDMDSPYAPVMDAIQIQPLSYQFTYSTRLIQDTRLPANHIAYQINETWLRSDKFLYGFVQGVSIANDCLIYIRDFALRGIGIDWQFAVRMASRGADTQPLRNLLASDAMLTPFKRKAGSDWYLVEKLIVFALEQDQHEIQWQPF